MGGAHGSDTWHPAWRLLYKLAEPYNRQKSSHCESPAATLEPDGGTHLQRDKSLPSQGRRDMFDPPRRCPYDPPSLLSAKMIMRGVSILLCLSVLAGASLGSSNCMVIHVDEDGHSTVAWPHLLHAHLHAEHADNRADDLGINAEHTDLHDHLGAIQNLASVLRKIERRGAIAQPDDCCPNLNQPSLAFAAPIWPQPSLIGVLGHAPRQPSLAARTERASLRAIVLLV